MFSLLKVYWWPLKATDVFSTNSYFQVFEFQGAAKFYKKKERKIEHRNDVICRKIIDSARNKKVQF